MEEAEEVTLQNVQLRDIFPRATHDVTTVVDVSQAAETSTVERGVLHLRRYATWVVIVGAALWWYTGYQEIDLPLPEIFGAVVVIGVIIALIRAPRLRSAGGTWPRWAADRGLVVAEPGALPEAEMLPLLRACEDTYPQLYAGPVGAHSMAIGTCWRVTEDSDGAKQYHYFQFVYARLTPDVAARYPATILEPQSTASSVPDDFRELEFESVDFTSRYTVFAPDDADDVALHELFSTTFIDDIAQGPRVRWQQRGEHLLVWESCGGSDPTAVLSWAKGGFTGGFRGMQVALDVPRLDGICRAAAMIATRFEQERM